MRNGSHEQGNRRTSEALRRIRRAPVGIIENMSPYLDHRRSFDPGSFDLQITATGNLLRNRTGRHNLDKSHTTTVKGDSTAPLITTSAWQSRKAAPRSSPFNHRSPGLSGDCA
jgi:hypothetical protein